MKTLEYNRVDGQIYSVIFTRSDREFVLLSPFCLHCHFQPNFALKCLPGVGRVSTSQRMICPASSSAFFATSRIRMATESEFLNDIFW